MTNVITALDTAKNVFEFAVSLVRDASTSSAQREQRTTWQSGWTAAGVKPLTITCLRGRCSVWHPAREFHLGPEP